jgi:hypothetical protein
MSALRSLEDLDKYCTSTLRRSTRQFESDGPLLDRGRAALADPTVWDMEWGPPELDYGEAHLHPVYRDVFTPAQRLAWSHLQWTLDYVTVAQGERQVIVLNGLAVRRYRAVLPSVCELEQRESDEEDDHVATFMLLGDAAWKRYFGADSEMRIQATSGFAREAWNPPVRKAIGLVADTVFGANFPTMFFLARGMKSHCFKPFEIAMARNEAGHPKIRAVSDGHGVDESRHIATSQHLARVSADLLDAIPQENKVLFRLAVSRLFPSGRMEQYRLAFWRDVLFRSRAFAGLDVAGRDSLWAHIETRSRINLEKLHPLQETLVHKANKRIVEEAGLNPELKRLFVDILRADRAYAPTVESVTV